MSVIYFNGFETGDASEMSSAGLLTYGATDQVRLGGFSAKGALGTTRGTSTLLIPGAGGGATLFVRGYVYISVTTPPSIQVVSDNSNEGLLALRNNNQSTANILVVYKTDGTIALRLMGPQGFGQIGSDYPISTSAWHRIELKNVLSATVGVCEMVVDGVVAATASGLNTIGTGSSSFSAANVYKPFKSNIQGAVSTTWFDDIQIRTDAYPGAGQVIARQGIAGAPTYDAWTKTGLSTSALCWSETPFNATDNCNTATSGATQSMLVGSFSASGSGVEGSGIIAASDLINACKTAVIVKSPSGGGVDSISILRRLNGVDTTTAITGLVSTTDKLFADAPWTDIVANLNAMEAGAVHTTNTNTVTVEDVWVMVDYSTASIASAAGLGSAAGVGAATAAAIASSAGSGVAAAIGASIAEAIASSGGIAAAAAVGAATIAAVAASAGIAAAAAVGASIAEAIASSDGIAAAAAVGASIAEAIASSAGIAAAAAVGASIAEAIARATGISTATAFGHLIGAIQRLKLNLVAIRSPLEISARANPPLTVSLSKVGPPLTVIVGEWE